MEPVVLGIVNFLFVVRDFKEQNDFLQKVNISDITISESGILTWDLNYNSTAYWGYGRTIHVSPVQKNQFVLHVCDAHAVCTTNRGW